jgi:cobyrinic acid a,c-diamide synthase
MLGPRLVIAGTHSGVGKTTVATGLMAALRRGGTKVASAKVGPDFIDPGYHSLATGRPGRNLDAWMCGAERMAPLAAAASTDADLLIIEGVMGLYDGSGATDEASTAHVARLLEAPVVLVVDASAMSGSVAALVHGYRTFGDGVRLAGVILNRVGSDRHESLLREALAPHDMPVLGVLRRDDRLTWRDRHLGLVPVVEQPDAIADALDALATTIAQGCDLEALVRLAHTAPATPTAGPPHARPVGAARIAVASGPAFSFCYPENLELLSEAGAELVPFDPAEDPSLPERVDGLYAGGGFPEVYAERLAANRSLLADVRDKVSTGLTTWAECGGLLWLARSLDGHPLCGVIDAEGRMTDRLSLGYRDAVVRSQSPLGPAGTAARGHEFHYSSLSPGGDAIAGVGGFAGPRMLASYLHIHLASDPTLAESFVRTAFTGS